MLPRIGQGRYPCGFAVVTVRGLVDQLERVPCERDVSSRTIDHDFEICLLVTVRGLVGQLEQLPCEMLALAPLTNGFEIFFFFLYKH